jgi:hypothetical protein
MANKQSVSKKTSTTRIERTAAGAGSARVAKPVTPRVKTVKHSKATVAEPLAIPETAEAELTAVQTQVEDPQTAIARIAYGYWAERGYQGGNSADDWFRAEAEYRRRFAAL